MGVVRITVLLAVLALTLGVPATALAQPAPPQVFVGGATRGTTPVAEGTEITAWIDGVQVATGKVTRGQFRVLVVPTEGKSYDGKTVKFKIGGVEAKETAVWQLGGADEVNLTAPAGPAPQTAPAAPGGQVPQPAAAAPAGQTPQPAAGAPAQQTGPAQTAAGSQEKRRAFVGTVDGTPGASVTLVRKGTGERVTVRLGSAEVKTPGGPVAGTFSNGAEVVILAQQEGAEWTALKVLVKPRQLVSKPVVGTVVTVADGVVTVALPDGSTKAMRLPQGVAAPQPGEVVTAFARDPETSRGRGSDGHPQVKGLVKASKVAERLHKILQDLSAAPATGPEKQRKARPQWVADVASILEEHDAQHLAMLEKLSKIGSLPPGALAEIQKGLEKARRGKEAGRGVANQARGKAGPPSADQPGIFGRGKKHGGQGDRRGGEPKRAPGEERGPGGPGAPTGTGRDAPGGRR